MQLFHNEGEEVRCEMPELPDRDRSLLERDRPFALLDRDGALTLLDVAHYQYMKRREWQHTLLTCFLLLVVTVLAAALVILVRINLQSHRDCEHSAITSTDGTALGQYRHEVRWTDSPNAHLTGLQNTSVPTDNLVWERERGDAHLHLFTYEEARGALVVQRSGRYSVYLHVTYRVSEQSCRDGGGGGGGGGGDGAVEVEQTVFVWSDSYQEDVPLLRALDSVGCSADAWAKSLYTAGVFSLSAGDRLMVKVFPLELVERHEKNLFFGAFFVAPETGDEQQEKEICRD